MSALGVALVVMSATVAAGAAVGAVPAVGATLRARRRSSELTDTSARPWRGTHPSVGRSFAWSAPSSALVARLRAAAGIDARPTDRELTELLQTVARELRSGASLSAAVVAAAEAVTGRSGYVDPATVALARAVRRGTPLATAVGSWTGASPSGSRRLAGTALVLAAETGGTTAVVVDGVADTLRDRVALEREVGALSSQARASAVVLVVAPVVVAVLATSADDRIAAFLLGTPLGWACIGAGLLLDAVGAAWMHLTIRRAT